MRNFCFALALGLAVSFSAHAKPEPKGQLDFSELALVPIQQGGRVKPLDSFAWESVLFVTGRRSFEGWRPAELLLSWMTAAKEWENLEFIQTSRIDVKRQLGLPETRSRFTPTELIRNSALAQYAEKMGSGAQAQSPPMGGNVPGQDARGQELRRLLDRVGNVMAIVSGDAWMIIPPEGASDSSSGAWESLSSAGGGAGGTLIRQKFADVLRAYEKGEAAGFTTATRELRTAVEGAMPGYAAQAGKLKVEKLYNDWRPYRVAWLLYFLGALLGAFALVAARPQLRRPAVALILTAMVFHVVGIALRCYVAGRPPVTNMYESVNWVSLGVLIFALVLWWSHRQLLPVFVGAFLSALGLLYADLSPAILDPSIQPLVPVLRSNYWLTIHVLSITLGYAAFFLSLGIADVVLFQYIRPGTDRAARDLKVRALNQLSYRALQFGIVLLAAGTILGGIWADYSWGRFWGWDPKETWALIALLCYLAVLHARYTGWMREFGFAAWTVASFLSVLMAWYGLNFVLGAGLHSYGFVSGGLGPVLVFIAAQLAYTAYAAFRVSREK